ncbi:MAG: recombinase family protein [Eubacteriales bacterium]|nr:recombinase family protein [Eubacteriales bacterium]
MQTSAARVTMIPAYSRPSAAGPVGLPAKKRVAGYARVSTDSEEQLTSYEAQVDYYTRYILSKEEWTLVEVYTDEGISATNTKKRDGFKRMIADALDGKIDLIITKSVSRFARNTVDSLTTVRQLKEKGVEIYFEKENIYTLDSKGELLITIMSSLAQEESRSLSENVKWGQRKRFADGKVTLPYKQFLGYEKGEDDLPKIVEKEAAIVRQIYALFLEGKTPHGIAKHLTQSGIPTPAGKTKWLTSTVESILTNEKYKGDALLQKNFTVDFLTKKMKPNEGEIPQYYVENSHPAIISPEIFDLVQYEMKKRKESGRYINGLGCFSGKIICGECGGTYGSKVWHSATKYRRIIWQCNHKYKSGTHCETPHLYEAAIQQAFVDAFNSLISNKDEILQAHADIMEALTDTADLDREFAKLQDEQDVVVGLMQKCVDENAHAALDQEEYLRRYGALIERYEAVKSGLARISDQRQERGVKREITLRFLNELRQQDTIIMVFDEDLWHTTVETATVDGMGGITFLFKSGTEIKIQPKVGI